jgi:hypothetical protein
MTEDLTDNDLIIRQINFSHIISRLMQNRIKDGAPKEVTEPFKA